MKKIVLFAAFLAFSTGFAQDATENKADKAVTLSAYGSFPEMNQAGVSVEFLGKMEKSPFSKKEYYSAKVAQLALAMMNYDAPLVDVDGTGFVAEIGSRTYMNNVNNGLYMGNYFSYGNIKFDDEILGLDFEGTYSYFSFFSPEVGYKIKFDKFSIDPFAGIMWKLEIKGKGDIDNKNVEEWTPRLGIKIGYQF